MEARADTRIIASQKEQLLRIYEREHATTMNVLRAFPMQDADLRPHPKCKTAKELAWMFVMERGLGNMVMNHGFPAGMSGSQPEPPARFEDVLLQLEQTHRQYIDLIRSYSDEQLNENVTFLVGPKTPGPIRRIDFAWMLLFDEIHHRGQFSIYLRMADGRVPSIYGPTADEPWI